MSAAGHGAIVAVAAAATLVLAACTAQPEAPSGAASSTEPGEPSPEATTTGEPAATPSAGVPDEASPVAQNLDAPWSITFDGDVALLSERDSGHILEIDASGNTRELDALAVTPGGEGGLLGIAVHQDHLYAYFTAGAENRLERFELVGERGSLALGPAQMVLEGIPAAANHNGGRIAFGPDGMLYVTVGDAGNRNSAQDLDSMAGKILRLSPDGDVPDDNPFPGSPVYSYGHRNPQGLAWDSDGTLYASEFGQSTWDELNVIEPGGNYGWPQVEGIAETDEFIDPVQQWAPADASPSGIAVHDGSVWIATLRGERLIQVPLEELTASTDHLVGEYGRLRDVVLAPDGSLWLLTNNTDGRGDPGPDDDLLLRLGASS